MSTKAAQSIQSDILDAIVAALGGNANGAYRCRFEAFQASELPADNVIPEDESPQYDSINDIDNVFQFHVLHTGASVDEVDKAIDRRYVTGQHAILADPTLGGLVRMTRYRGRKWEMDGGKNLDTVTLKVTYECEFSQDKADPSKPGF